MAVRGCYALQRSVESSPNSSNFNITKRRGAGYKLGEFQYKVCVTLVCIGGTQSLYKHKILRTYNKNFEL